MKRSIFALHRVELLYTFARQGGFMYFCPILISGDTMEEPLKSKLVLFEDGQPLRRPHEQHSIIAGTGRGAYSHWEHQLFFSASDNSDPNNNGRLYSYGIDYHGQLEAEDDGVVALAPPFYPQGGLCWGVAVADEGDNVTSGAVSELQLFENERPLGPGHAQHADILSAGSGRYSHWERYLYFSTSDGSDPNTNGRLYTYEIAGSDL